MDDIQFLKKNAFKEEYVCVIDSAKRNKEQYPTPNEYVVEFDAPFTNVYGIDIIDVQIPRSGYIVDTFNNTVFFRFFLDGGPAPPEDNGKAVYYKGTLRPGNYDEETLKNELNVVLKSPDIPDLAITVDYATTPFSKSRKFIFTCDSRFEFDAVSSLSRSILGLGEVSAVVSSSALAGTTLQDGFFVGTIVPDTLFPITRDKYMFQKFIATVTGVITSMKLQIGAIGVPPVSSRPRITMVRENDGIAILSRELDIQASGVYELTWSTNDLDIPVIDISFGYAIYVTDDVNTDINNCWAIFHGETSQQHYGNLSTRELGYDSSYYDIIRALAINITLTLGKQAIVPSGIVDLFGERYIQLRCQEVEEHMYRNRAYEKYNVGLAVISTSREYENISQRYVLLPSRSFHPIGKLKKMTFRFETSSGILYNFNGIDHTVTMVIRYYRINEAPMLDRHLLNAEYNPDFFKYMNDVVYRDEEDDEGEEDEEETMYAGGPQAASLHLFKSKEGLR